MYDDVTRLNDDELRLKLIDAYAQTGVVYPDTQAVENLKGELYRRGHERDEIVVLALTALLHISRN
jgi:hypothetical protein